MGMADDGRRQGAFSSGKSMQFSGLGAVKETLIFFERTSRPGAYLR
jgi:hypothetical protein